MSALGYGVGYNQSWRESSQPQAYPTAFGVAPAANMPNFAPTATAAWADPVARQVGTYHGESNAPGQGGSTDGAYWARDPWSNPLDALVGYSSDPIGYGKGNAVGSRMDTIPLIGYGHGEGDGPNVAPTQGSAGMRGYGYGDSSGDRRNFGIPDTNVYGWTMANPEYMNKDGSKYHQHLQNAQELYNSIGSMSLDQMMRMSGGGLTLADKYSQVAQQYANAYANPNYGKNIGDMQANRGGMNNLTQQQTTDWLQKSYGEAFKKLDSAYLL